MIVQVTRVHIPAMSTIGYGYGTDVDTGAEVEFVGDHRPMRELGQLVALAARLGEEPPTTEIEDWQLGVAA